jgi:LacI family transcriptional regulator
LAGHDDFLLASSLRPSVTVVQQPVEEIGRMAAKLLFERLAHHADKPASEQETRTRTVRLKSRLILRASCGCEEVEPTGLLPAFRLNHHAELPGQTDETGTGL